MPRPSPDPPANPSAAHACKHQRTQLIAKDDDTQYVECLGCGEIFETGELPEGNSFEGSLSDA